MNLQLFQAEMFSRQQILYSIISDGHRLLDLGQVDDRSMPQTLINFPLME